jgi:hypothetical protein
MNYRISWIHPNQDMSGTIVVYIDDDAMLLSEFFQNVVIMLTDTDNATHIFPSDFVKLCKWTIEKESE